MTEQELLTAAEQMAERARKAAARGDAVAARDYRREQSRLWAELETRFQAATK